MCTLYPAAREGRNYGFKVGCALKCSRLQRILQHIATANCWKNTNLQYSRPSKILICSRPSNILILFSPLYNLSGRPYTGKNPGGGAVEFGRSVQSPVEGRRNMKLYHIPAREKDLRDVWSELYKGAHIWWPPTYCYSKRMDHQGRPNSGYLKDNRPKWHTS